MERSMDRSSINTQLASLCPICNKASGRHIVSLPPSIIACPICQLARTEPKPVLRDADYADDTVNVAAGYSQNEPLFRSFHAAFIAFLKQKRGMPVPGERLLDVGCSVGFLLDEASKLGYLVEGVELDRHAVHLAQSRGLKVRQGILDSYFEDDSFSVVTMSHVLEHIDQLSGILAEVRRVLRTDGVIVISQPDYTGLVPRIWKRAWYGWQPQQHFWHFNTSSLRLLFEQEGFHVIASERNSLHHPWPVFELRNWRGLCKQVLMATTARIGHKLGLGDQFYMVARASQRS